MTDPWARPTGDHRVVEIELSGGEPPAPARSRGAGGTTATDRPRGRRRTALTVVGALVAGGLIAAVVTAGDGDDASPDAQVTLDPSQITTPPTLLSLETLPPIDAPPTPATFPAASIGEQPRYDPADVTVPAFDVVPGVTPDELDAYDLLGAVAANGVGGTPMRTKMRLDGVQSAGLLRSALEVTASHDPVARLASLVVQGSVGERAEIVFDQAQQSLFRTDNAMNGQWQQFAPDDLLAGTGTDVVDALFDSFATGPITPTALSGGVVVAADGLVRLNGGAIARPYRVTVPVEALRPYGLLLMANVYERSVESGQSPSEIAFDVYVTDQPALALVAARFEVGNIVYVLQQFFDRRPANILIRLPTPEAIIDGAGTRTPAPMPVTTLAPVTAP